MRGGLLATNKVGCRKLDGVNTVCYPPAFGNENEPHSCSYGQDLCSMQMATGKEDTPTIPLCGCTRHRQGASRFHLGLQCVKARKSGRKVCTPHDPRSHKTGCKTNRRVCTTVPVSPVLPGIIGGGVYEECHCSKYKRGVDTSSKVFCVKQRRSGRRVCRDHISEPGSAEPSCRRSGFNMCSVSFGVEG